MSFSMRRWTEDGDPPEAGSDATNYGTAMHYCFHIIETEGLTDREALQRTFDKYGHTLWPDDLIRLKKDLVTYHEREPLGVRLIGSEIDARIPLLDWGGQTIYFRGQIDRLYERLDRPGHWLHRDYKSSRWEKTQEEVDKDPQLWAYNLLIHEYWPECESLHQTLDQLEFQPLTTSKNESQRQYMKDWLAMQVVSILSDDSVQEDGLLQPKFNQWCATCSIATDCPIIPQLSKFAQTRIKAMSDSMGVGLDEAESSKEIQEYVDLMEEAAQARKVLDKYEKQIKGLIKELPPHVQRETGYEVAQRAVKVFDPLALQEIHRALGPEFYEIISIAQTKLSAAIKDRDDLEPLLDLAISRPGTSYLRKKGRDRRKKN
jgi:hypothetical protein